ncbi:MAG: hypothetical protein ABRQ24_04315 [Syntrophomonadaceae bacterium]
MGARPFYLVFLQSTPETVILIFLGALLIGLRPPWQRVLLVALLTSLASYFIRALPLPPGVSVFLQLPVLIALLAYFCALPVTYAAVVSLLGFVLLGVSEAVYCMLAAAITGITVPEAMAHPLWLILYPLPEFLLLGLIILALIRYDVVIYDIREAFEEKRLNHEEEQST